MRDAARAACVSRAFESSWRRRPNLTLDKRTLGPFGFIGKVDRVLRKHSRVGVKTFELDYDECGNPNSRNYLDSWLPIAVTPGIEKLILKLNDRGLFKSEFPEEVAYSWGLTYNFPCSLLSDGSGSSIQHLELECCVFQPTFQLGSFGSLTNLHLRYVCINGEELECLLSSSVMLEQLELDNCLEIMGLKIPGLLHRLSHLLLRSCGRLQVIENEARNLRSIYIFDAPAGRSPRESIRFGELLQLKNVDMWCSNAAYFARSDLPSIAPNLETLTLGSPSGEMANTPMAPSKFLHLKYLSIELQRMNFSPTYDYFSLVSFIDASPSLETFNLTVSQTLMVMTHELVFGAPSSLRRMPQYGHHHNLRSLNITGFSSVKSLVELVCHILENATSLKCVTLDTTLRGVRRVAADSSATKALSAIRKYIQVKVPGTVELRVM